MVFSLWPFLLIFLPIALIGFVSIPVRLRTARKLWLCAASVVFYAYWKVGYVPLLFFSIAPRFLRLKLNALGVCFFAVIRIHFYAPTSPFLYFNF